MKENFFPGLSGIEKYERILQESEEKFKKLSEATTEGIIIHENGKIIQVNKAFCKISGYSENELIGKDAFFMLPNEYIEKVKKGLLKLSEQTFEQQGIRKDGKKIMCQITPKTIYIQEKPVRVVAILDITEKKRYENELKESKDNFKMLFEMASDAICILDENGNCIDVNPRALKILGYTKEEVLKLNLKDVISKKDVERIPLLALESLQTGERVFRERVLVKKDGSEVSVEASLTKLPNKQIQIIVRDISERKIAERVLVNSERNYRNLIESIPYGIFIHDEKGNVIFANPSALKIMGIRQLTELKNPNLFHYVLPEFHDTIKNRKKAVDRGEKVDFSIAKVKRADNKIIEVESKPISINFAGKTATLVVYHDISVQRQLEKEQMRAQIAEESNKKLQKEIIERNKAEQELTKTQKYSRSLIEASLDIICASDNEGKITEFNTAAQKIFGYNREEAIGMDVTKLYVRKQERLLVLEELDQKGVFKGEIFNVKKNGDVFVSYLSASYLKNESGQTIGVMGVSRDITEVKETQEKIKKSLKEKESLLKEVHHRVKNNLQVVSSILSLQTSYIEDLKTKELLKETQNRIKSMAFIHEALYQTKDLSNIRFSDNIKSITNNLVHSYAKDNKINIVYDLQDIDFNIDIAIPLGLIINELVSNSLKYAFPEEKKGKIHIALKKVKNKISIFVEDNGIGLPVNINFRKTDTLGLQLVVALTEQLSGKISLYKDFGTKFVIDIEDKHN